MKTTLCLLVYDELAGCKTDVPRLPRDGFDDVYAVDGGSTDGTVAYLESQDIPVHKQVDRRNKRRFLFTEWHQRTNVR